MGALIAHRLTPAAAISGLHPPVSSPLCSHPCGLASLTQGFFNYPERPPEATEATRCGGLAGGNGRDGGGFRSIRARRALPLASARPASKRSGKLLRAGLRPAPCAAVALSAPLASGGGSALPPQLRRSAPSCPFSALAAALPARLALSARPSSPSPTEFRGATAAKAGSHRSAEEADHRSMMGDDSTDASRDQSAQARRPSAALDAPTACVRRAVPAARARSSESLRPSRPLRALLRPQQAIG